MSAESFTKAEGETLERAPIASLRSLFETWPLERILYEDADLIAVDKPEGISTHAPDELRKDDVYTRLLAHLAENPGGEPPYLGIHQRLDRDTSGVLIFARRKAANAKLAEQFEGRRIAKTYVAVVEGTLRLPPNGILRHLIEEGKDGVRVARSVDSEKTKRAPRTDRGARALRPKRADESTAHGAKEATTLVRVLEKTEKRSLVELTPRTGRTHQLRVQLAAAGAPIVGDQMYGGAPARRLMLHAREIGLVHPTTGEAVTISCPPPDVLREALDGELDPYADATKLDLLMRESAAKRYGIVSRLDTDVVRLANGAGDGLPGVALDAYGDHLVVHLSEDLPESARTTLFNTALRLGASSVYVKYRPKHASRIVDARREEFAPKRPIRGESAPDAFLVQERGTPFEARLGDGLSTGLFLDQRENRARVREWAAGARVLNLFAYTGSFSVAAVLGGARATTTVDVSRGITEWAERNLRRVGADPKSHVVIEADCFTYLEQAAERKERFDLVVLDPPSFATTKTSRFSADGGYRALAAQALRIVDKGGRLLACTNHQGIVMAKFRRFLHEAARDAGVNVTQMKSLPPPEDFPPVPGFEPHLKCVVLRLG